MADNTSRIPWILRRALALQGNGTHTVATLAANRTLLDTDAQFLVLDPGGVDRDVSLPAEEDSKGRFYVIRNSADAEEDLVVINDSLATIGTLSRYEFGLFICDGTSWVMAGHATAGADLGSLAAGIVDVAADSFGFVDGVDGGSYKESIADLVTAMAGDGFTATAGVFSVDVSDFAGAGLADDGSENLIPDIHGLAEAVMDPAADYIAFSDESAVGDPTQRESWADVATAIAGDGIQASAGVLAVDVSDFAGAGLADDGSENLIPDIHGLAEAAVDVAADYFAFSDESAVGDVTQRESIADLATAMAGNGLGATAGVFSVTPDATTGGNVIPLDVSANGVGLDVDDIDGTGITANGAGLLNLDLGDLTAAAVDVAADSIAFLDVTDSVTKLESLADLATAQAGDGIQATAGVLAVDVSDFAGAGLADDGTENLIPDIHGLAEAAVDVAADYFAFSDESAVGDITQRESIADLMTAVAGDGIQATAGVLAVDVSDFAGAGLADDGTENLIPDIHGLAEAAIDVATDYIAFSDESAVGDVTQRESVADLVTAMAGTGLTATNGVLSSDMEAAYLNLMVKATVAVADAPAGATEAAMTVDLFQRDGVTAINTARQVLIVAQGAQYSPPGQGSPNPTFGAATAGSIIAAAAGWVLGETDATGNFNCTVTNATDETLYFAARSPEAVSDLAKACIVIASNSDDATWSA